MRMTSARGFTFIELMVVLVIITALISILTPVMGIVQRFAMTSTTQAVARQVDTCLRLFKNEWGVYPHQSGYPDLAAGETFTNRLFYHLGTDIAAADRAKLLQDADTVAAKFNFNLSGTQPSALTYTPDIMEDVVQDKRSNCAALANRMAMEQVRLAVLAGNLEQRGPVVADAAGAIVADKRSLRMLESTEITSGERPGWACDYLAGELEQRFIQGEAIVDAWGNPLVYVCQVIPGIQGTSASIYGSLTTLKAGAERFGFGPIGFNPLEGPGPGLVPSRPRLLYNGRIRLSRSDAGDGQPTPPDPTFFPDAAKLMRSDVRYYAAPGFEAEFELWSAGGDGRFAYLRDDPANRDNVSAVPYHAGLEK